MRVVGLVGSLLGVWIARLLGGGTYQGEKRVEGVGESFVLSISNLLV